VKLRRNPNNYNLQINDKGFRKSKVSGRANRVNGNFSPLMVKRFAVTQYVSRGFGNPNNLSRGLRGRVFQGLPSMSEEDGELEDENDWDDDDDSDSSDDDDGEE